MFSDPFDYLWKHYYENGHDYDYYRKESQSKFLTFLLLVSLILIFTGLFLIALSFIISSFIIRHYYLKHKEKVDKRYAAERREKTAILNEEPIIDIPIRPVAPANVFRDRGNRNNVVDLNNLIIQSRISNDALCSSIEATNKILEEPALDTFLPLGEKFKNLDLEEL